MFGKLLVEIRGEGLQMSEKKEMTREEAIEIFEQKGWWIAQKETFTSKQAEEIIKLNDAVNFALSALRPVSREQVEKVWRGEWKPIERLWKYSHQWQCSRCGQPTLTDQKQFCDFCGAPMTGEAVEMVMERLEALYERNDD